MKKVALPVRNNKLSVQFDQCAAFLIYTVEENKKSSEEKLITHLQPGLYPYWLARKGVTDLIVDSISLNMIHKLDQYKIHVFVGVNEKDPKILMEKYLNSTLETNNVSAKIYTE